ncbi:hypothetical protein EST38_g4282 [Candolleomyces aberdarensis]|uniref:O-methylsterigmatocystin oxidoreductase n=1 Tax=Candolleomyces aberdarensis TaxID=2316362 RepID=A0A4Q2DNH2_9AGAR|nr:hypothetical protein EST38_g4282 [Candolleomyces aberdarensis]
MVTPSIDRPPGVAGSDIIALEALGMNIIVLDSAEAVSELLERRSHIYSNRPRLPMICELMGWEFNIGLMRYGERCMAGHVVLSIAYGIEPKAEDDPYIRISEEAIHYLVEAAVPGAFLVDIIPAMKYIPEWMPFAHFQRFAKTSRGHIERMRQKPFEEAKHNASATSFVRERLEEMDRTTGIDVKAYEEVVMNTASAMFVGGFDTIIAALCAFMFAMMTHPEVQRRAQSEIDAVLPSGQLPTFEDRESLPYITAMVKEVLRWKPITPMAAAHVLDVDDDYKGYHLPAGSRNQIEWSRAILNDEKIYPDPLEFKPERFLDSKEDGKEPCPDPWIAFGFGRRFDIC